jgi:hypothetical protein
MGMLLASPTSGLRAPLPNPPRKGEGAGLRLWHRSGHGLDRHLPLDGGGWEGGRPTHQHFSKA